jgi:hypothetical protein
MTFLSWFPESSPSSVASIGADMVHLRDFHGEAAPGVNVVPSDVDVTQRLDQQRLINAALKGMPKKLSWANENTTAAAASNFPIS